MRSDIETLDAFYAALNRNDLAAALRDFDPQIVRIEPDGFPTSGSHRGIETVRALFVSARERWAEGRCKPERFLARSDKLVVDVHVRVRLKDAIDWVNARIADGFVLRNGRIVEFRTFVQRADALAWAGIDEAMAR